MFAIALLLARLCGELCAGDAVEQYKRLHALASMSRYDSERAAFLVRAADGRLTTIAWPAGDKFEASYSGRIPPHCVAVIHTHPPAAPLPSKHDSAEARRIALPIVVITAKTATVATPDGRTIVIWTAGAMPPL